MGGIVSLTQNAIVPAPPATEFRGGMLRCGAPGGVSQPAGTKLFEEEQMNKSHWISATIFTTGLLVGLLIAQLWIPSRWTRVYAQGTGAKQVRFVLTGNMTTPGGKPGVERWQDPETKAVCYVTTGSDILWHEVGFSCVR